MIFKALLFVTLLSSSLSIKTNERRLSNEDSSNDKVIYVDISLNESLKGHNPYLHYVNGETEQNINLVLDSNDIYHSESSVSFSTEGHYDICCDTDFVIENIVNNSLIENDYNYICVGNDISISGYGYYTERLTNPGATYRTQRVWLYNTNHYFSMNDEWGNKRTTCISYYDNDKWNVIEMPYVINTYDKKEYYYADIPSNINSFRFLCTANSDNHNYLVYNNYAITQQSYGVCYCLSDAWLGDSQTPWTIIVEDADATLLSMVVESYLTYGKDFSNGCSSSTIKNLFLTWFEHKSASANDLKSAKILDYSGYSSNGNSYEGLEKSSSFSVNEKWNTMCSQAGIDPKTGKARSINLSWLSGNTGKFVLIVGGVSFIVVLSLVVLMIIKRRKNKE